MFRIYINVVFPKRERLRETKPRSYKSYWNGKRFGSIHFAKTYDENAVCSETCAAAEHLYHLPLYDRRKFAHVELESI